MKSRLPFLFSLLPLLPACTEVGTTPPPATCSASAVDGVEVAESDFYGGTPYALGYPPYAIDACRLVYVARASDGGPGELRLRDLSTGKEQVLAPASEKARRPTIAGPVIAWEASQPGQPGGVVRVTTGGDAVTITGAFDHAGEPRAADDAVVFTGWLGADGLGDTDVFLYLPSTGEVTALVKAPGQQRFADVSATHVAWTDFAEDPDGTFNENETDVADVVVLDRATGTVTSRHRDGKQAFPMLGASGKLSYLDWAAVHPEPKFSGYGLNVVDVAAPPEEDVTVESVTTLRPYVRPVARGAFLEWVAWPNGGTATLTRRRADLSLPAETILSQQGIDLIGPTASDTLSLVGAREAGKPLQLKAFARP